MVSSNVILPRLIVSIVSKSKMQLYVASHYQCLKENGICKPLQRLLFYQEETTSITKIFTSSQSFVKMPTFVLKFSRLVWKLISPIFHFIIERMGVTSFTHVLWNQNTCLFFNFFSLFVTAKFNLISMSNGLISLEEVCFYNSTFLKNFKDVWQIANHLRRTLFMFIHISIPGTYTNTFFAISYWIWRLKSLENSQFW